MIRFREGSGGGGEVRGGEWFLLGCPLGSGFFSLGFETGPLGGRSGLGVLSLGEIGGSANNWLRSTGERDRCRSAELSNER